MNPAIAKYKHRQPAKGSKTVLWRHLRRLFGPPFWLPSWREREDAIVHHAPKEHSPALPVAWKMPRKQDE
jgi:hypothetical protein